MTDAPLWKTHPLLATMWKTKNSRFHAANRLRSRGSWKGITLSILSAYVLVISVAPKFIDLGGENAHRDYLGLFVLTASMFILVFSVMSIFDEDKLRYNYMHDNAREISKIYHAYKLAIEAAEREGSPSPESDPINEKYQLALEKCPYNHDSIDWLKTLIDIQSDEGRLAVWMRIRLFGWLFYDIYFWPVFAITFPWIAAFLLFRHV